MSQLNLPCWDLKWQFSSLCPVWVWNLSKAQVLLGPNQTQVLAPGCEHGKGIVYGSTFWWDFQWLLKIHSVTQTPAAWPGMCCLLTVTRVGKLWSDQTTYTCFQELPCSPLPWKQDLTISPEVSEAQSLQLWQVSDNQKYDTAKEKKKSVFIIQAELNVKSKQTA